MFDNKLKVKDVYRNGSKLKRGRDYYIKDNIWYYSVRLKFTPRKNSRIDIEYDYNYNK